MSFQVFFLLPHLSSIWYTDIHVFDSLIENYRVCFPITFQITFLHISYSEKRRRATNGWLRNYIHWCFTVPIATITIFSFPALYISSLQNVEIINKDWCNIQPWILAFTEINSISFICLRWFKVSWRAGMTMQSRKHYLTIFLMDIFNSCKQWKYLKCY